MSSNISPNNFLTNLQAFIVKNDQDGIINLIRDHKDTANLVQKHLLSLPDDTPQVEILRQLGSYLFDLNASILAETAGDIDIHTALKADIVTEAIKDDKLTG